MCKAIKLSNADSAGNDWLPRLMTMVRLSCNYGDDSNEGEDIELNDDDHDDDDDDDDDGDDGGDGDDDNDDDDVVAVVIKWMIVT